MILNSIKNIKIINIAYKNLISMIINSIKNIKIINTAYKNKL